MNLVSGILVFIMAIQVWPMKCICQSVYFNKTIDLQGAWGTGMSVIASDSAYYIAGIAGPGYNIAIVKVGLTGNEEGWIKKFGKPNESWYPGNSGSLCSVQSGGLILGGSIGTADTSYGLL
jgi:hypothetical protein